MVLVWVLVGSSNKGCSQSISLNMDYEDYDQVSKNYDSSEDICQIMY